MRKITFLLCVCGAAAVNAAPVFPPAPSCIFNGSGTMVLTGEWKKHPVFKKYSPDVSFQFKGIRDLDGKTRIRYVEDFGETACEVQDNDQESNFWYRGTDNIFKSSYGDHAFQGGVIPFEYSIILNKNLESKVKDLGFENQEQGYRIAETNRDNGKIITDFYVKTKGNQIYDFRKFLTYSFPKQNFNLAFDNQKISWSDEVIALGVPKSQTSEFFYGIQSPKPEMTIKIVLNFTDLRPIPDNLDVEKYREELVSGLFKSQKPIPPRRMPEAAVTQQVQKKPYLIFLFGGAGLMCFALYSFLKGRKAN